jgi:hypothetical protein
MLDPPTYYVLSFFRALMVADVAASLGMRGIAHGMLMAAYPPMDLGFEGQRPLSDRHQASHNTSFRRRRVLPFGHRAHNPCAPIQARARDWLRLSRRQLRQHAHVVAPEAQRRECRPPRVTRTHMGRGRGARFKNHLCRCWCFMHAQPGPGEHDPRNNVLTSARRAKEHKP